MAFSVAAQTSVFGRTAPLRVARKVCAFLGKGHALLRARLPSARAGSLESAAVLGALALVLISGCAKRCAAGG